MRVVIDASVIRPPLSGVHLAVRQESAALARELGPNACVLTPDHVLMDRARQASALCHPCLGTSRSVVRRILWQQLQLPRLVRREHAQVLCALAYTAPIHCPIPYVLHVHDLIALEHPGLCSPMNVVHMRALLPISIRRAAAVIVSSTHVGEAVKTRFGVVAERIHRVPLGVQARYFADGGERALPAAIRGRPYALFIGNLEPKKGLEALVRAYGMVCEEIGCDLVLAGRMAWRPASLLRSLRESPAVDHIHLLGRVEQGLLPELYRRAWAFIFPSRVEGFGLPILEAMAAGTPVIHSDHAALMETAGGAGLACRVGDHESLATEMRRLHRSAGLRSRLTEMGKARAGSLPWSRWGTAAAGICRKIVSE